MVMLDFICMDTAVRNGEGAKNSKMKIYVSSGIRSPWFNVLPDSGIQIYKTISWQQVSNIDYGYICIWFWTDCQTKSIFLISM